MLQPKAAERRQYPRKQVNVEVFITCPGSPPLIEKVHMHDLSLGGMAISLPAFAVREEQIINICFVNQPNDCEASHVIEARIMRVGKTDIGVAFESVGVQCLRDIHQLLRGERFF